MKKQKAGKRAAEKRPYNGPRITVLSSKSAKARRLLADFDGDSGNSEDQESGSTLKSEPEKAKKRSA